MTTVNTYVIFKGNCREAFKFYQSVFGGDFSYVATFGEMPQQEGMPPIPDSEKNKIMHIGLPISKETFLMGSDALQAYEKETVVGNNFSISVNTDSTDEADRLFNQLSKDGHIKMPMSKTFWGSYFGMFTDKFSINWMISVELNES